MTTPTKVEEKNEASVQPFKLEENWIDGGWCSIGDGKFRQQVRLMLGLGAQKSFGSTQMYASIAADIKAGNLGPARIATEIKTSMARPTTVGATR